MGIGVDIIQISRIKSIVDRSASFESRFLSKVLNDIEIQEYKQKEETKVKY